MFVWRAGTSLSSGGAYGLSRSGSLASAKRELGAIDEHLGGVWPPLGTFGDAI